MQIPHTYLGNVAIHIPILPLHIILLNQAINILLDITHAKHASTHGRLDDFSHKLLMRDQLATLENADDSGLTLEVAIFRNTNVCFLVLFLCLFELDLVDLDTVLGVLEVLVDGERVGFVDVAALWMFCKRP